MTTLGGRDERERFYGAIFDVDGVLVDSPHERAWREALQELLQGPWTDIRDATTWTPGAFTPQVYQREVSGKPRLSGALAALGHFEVPDAHLRAEEYAERKQSMVVRLIEAGEFTAFPDALRFVLAVRESGLKVAVASSSKNAGRLLELIRLDEYASEIGQEYNSPWGGKSLRECFDADVSGRDFARGKPYPDMFVAAASALGRRPQECFVVEDAAAGVRAARAGGMSALGVARADDSGLLAAAEADLVVKSLDDVSIEALRDGRLVKR